MKKITLSLCLLAAPLLSCSLASAASFTGGSVTLDVPEGWTSTFKKDNPGELRLVAPGDAFRMVIWAGSANGMTSLQGVRMLAKTLNGTEPKPAGKSGIYTFEGQSGTPRCMVMIKGKRMVAIMEGSGRQGVQQQIGPMMQSLASTEGDEQGIFDALKVFFQ